MRKGGGGVRCAIGPPRTVPVSLCSALRRALGGGGEQGEGRARHPATRMPRSTTPFACEATACDRRSFGGGGGSGGGGGARPDRKAVPTGRAVSPMEGLRPCLGCAWAHVFLRRQSPVAECGVGTVGGAFGGRTRSLPPAAPEGATPRRTSRTPVAFFFAPQSRRSGAKGREGGPQGHQGTPPYRTRGRGGLQVKNREHIRFGCGTAGVSGVGHTAGRT